MEKSALNKQIITVLDNCSVVSQLNDNKKCSNTVIRTLHHDVLDLFPCAVALGISIYSTLQKRVLVHDEGNVLIVMLVSEVE